MYEKWKWGTFSPGQAPSQIVLQLMSTYLGICFPSQEELLTLEKKVKKTALRQKRKFDIFQVMSQKKRSIADGLGALALGSVLTTGGVAAGVTAAASAASQVKHVQQASGDQELQVSIDKHKIDENCLRK